LKNIILGVVLILCFAIIGIINYFHSVKVADKWILEVAKSRKAAKEEN
jgi:hypothetical protein